MKSQPTKFYLALLSVPLSVLLIFLIVKMAAEPDGPIPCEFPRFVKTIDREKGLHKASLFCYGNAQAAQEINLLAPISGKVLTEELYLGKRYQAGKEILRLDTQTVDRQINALGRDKASLLLQVKQSSLLLRDTVEKLSHLAEEIKLSLESLEREKESEDISRELFEKSKKLYRHKNLSHSQYLQKKHSFIQSQKQNIRKKREHLDLLEVERSQSILLTNKEYQQEILQEKTQKINIQIEELKQQRSKAFFSLDYPSEITAVLTKSGQEVLPGQKLLSIRSLEEVRLKFSIPDHQLGLFWARNLPMENFSFSILNARTAKEYKGATLLSFLSSLERPSRSFHLLLSYTNPLNSQGLPIIQEELLPGMPCTMKLELRSFPFSFSFPPEIFQENKGIYFVIKDAEDKERLSILSDYEILHQGEEEVILSLPPSFETIKAIIEPLLFAEENLLLEVR